MNNKKKILIVGAGPGGLTAGMMLANKGHDVTIYEKHTEVGGRNGAIKLGDYTFDIGPTFLMMKHVYEEIFEFTGRNVEDYVSIKQVEPMYRLDFGEGKVFYPYTDSQKMKEEMERVFPGSSDKYQHYLDKETKKYETLIPCLQMPYGKMADYLSPQFLRSLPSLDIHTSLFNVLGRYFDEDDLKISFTFQAKYIGMSPWMAPGIFSIISYIEHSMGIWHVMGGLNQLSAGMAKAFQEDGGTIHTSTPVKELLIDKRKVTGVRLENGEEIHADDVIINADFAYAMNHLVDRKHTRKWTSENLEKKNYSCSTYMLYLGVNKQYPDIPHHNIIFAPDYKSNVDDITVRFTLTDEPSFYVQNASILDESLAPKGKSAIYILVPIPNAFADIDWSRERAGFRDKIIRLAETKGGFTNLNASIEEEMIITPDEWQSTYNVYKGATFNLGHDVNQMLYFRPHNKFEEWDHCYLVGGGTHPGSGLPTIYESGRITANLIMKGK